jgi:hypothetical protein
MTTMLRAEGHAINRKRVQRLMPKIGIAALGPKPRTTNPAPGHKIFPYLLARLYIGAAFLLKLTPDPADYYRFTPAALIHLCRKFEVLSNGSNRGPASTMCDLLIRYLAVMFCCNRDRLYGVLVEVFRCGLAWTKYLDRK